MDENDCKMKTFPPRVLNKILPASSHVYEALLFMTKHSFIAILLVFLRVFIYNNLYRRGACHDISPTLDCKSEDVVMTFALQIFATCLHRLCIFLLSKQISVGCLTLELLVLIVGEISKHDIYFHFHLTAAMPEVIL